MTPAQAIVENERERAGMVTTPQAEQQMQRGRSAVIAQMQSAQAAYEAWLVTEAGRAAKEHAEVFALHIAFDAVYGARDEWLRHTRETLAERANHDDKLFAQLCAEDSMAQIAIRDEQDIARP